MFKFLFVTYGCATRLECLFLCIFWAVMFMAYLALAKVFGFESSTIGLYAFSAIACLSSLATIIRRLHDLDLSGYVLAIIGVLIVINVWMHMTFVIDLGSDVIGTTTLISWFLSGFTGLFFIMLLIWPGKIHGNRFAM